MQRRPRCLKILKTLKNDTHAAWDSGLKDMQMRLSDLKKTMPKCGCILNLHALVYVLPGREGDGSLSQDQR